MKITEEMKKESDIPNEIWVSFEETVKTSVDGYYWPCVFKHKRDYTVKYTRHTLQPSPQPDTVTISRESFERVGEAICQVLDDGGYYNHNDEIYVAPDRTHGGGYCHQAALDLIAALSLLNAKGKV